MRSDLRLIPGNLAQPVVILIHGLGMNRHFWSDPEQCRVLGGLAPLSLFLNDPPDIGEAALFSFGRPDGNSQGLMNALIDAGFGVAAWSQSRPVGPIETAIAELAHVVDAARRRWPDRPIALVGHSRGGLIARRYLLDSPESGICALVTISSPHAGTLLAGFARYLRPAAKLLERILPPQDDTRRTAAFSRLAMFFKSRAVEELSPGSDFMRSLGRPLPAEVRALTIGGTNPVLFRLYARVTQNDEWRGIALPDILLKALPASRVPAELTPGLGDGLVSAASARLAETDNTDGHHNFDCNHIRIAYNKKVRELVLDFLTSPPDPFPSFSPLLQERGRG